MNIRYSMLLACLIQSSVYLCAKEQDYTGYSQAAVGKALSRVKSLILELRIDLHECYAERIRDAKELTLFLTKLCSRLKITDTEDTRHIIYDGSLVGASLGCIFIQVSEDVYIIGRVINATNTVQLTLSSSMNYNTQEIADLAQKFFGASSMDVKISIRK